MTILLDSWIWLEFFLEGKKFEHVKIRGWRTAGQRPAACSFRSPPAPILSAPKFHLRIGGSHSEPPFKEWWNFSCCKKLLENIRDGKEHAVISSFTLTEVYYRLSAVNELAAHEQIHLLEMFPNIRIIPVVIPIAKLAAELRRKYYTKERQVSYGDMVHLATALLTGCTTLYSGDPDFEGIEEIKTVVF